MPASRNKARISAGTRPTTSTAFCSGYQAWQDTAWLDWGVRYYDFLTGKLLTGPDGYQGWIGPYEYDNSVWCDVHVGDAILFNGLVAFAEVVLADAKLRDRYGAQAHQVRRSRAQASLRQMGRARHLA